VTFERAISDRIPAVMCDNYQGGALATKHLLKSGCRHLAILCGSLQVHLPADDRTQAFINVCKEARIEPIVFPTNEAQFEARQYASEIAMMLDSYPRIDGIFATSDVMAAQVIQVCAKRNIRIPQDIKLVGFDDVEIASLTTPTLTTIHQPIEQMCSSAVDLIIRQLHGESAPGKTVLPVSLIERESTSRDLK
jgi:LacI family sucrose operon transcriptional repressor